MVVGRAVGPVAARGRDAGELRVRPQQLAARDVAPLRPVPGQQPRERVRHLLRQPVVRRIVSNRRRGEVLQRYAVQLSHHRQVLARRADVGRLDQEQPGQLALQRRATSDG